MYGKIARLAREIREELNRRLDDNVPAKPLLAWLNRLPAVRSVLKEQFGGVPISKQNLSEWRLGGFVRWQSQRELLTQARDMGENAEELSSVSNGRLTDHLATVLAARYAGVLSDWSGEVSEGMQQQLKSLHGLCRNIVALRRGDYHCTRLRLEEVRTEMEREKTKEEMVGYFKKWVENCKVQAVLAESHQSETDITQRRKGAKTQKKTLNHKDTKVRRSDKAAGGRAGRANKGAKSKQVDTAGQLRQLFGLPAKPDLSEPEPQGGGQSGAENGSPHQPQTCDGSKSVKHSQTSAVVKTMADKSDGGTIALQQLDVALAEKTKPVISEAEKTRHFMEVLFGIQPVTSVPEPQGGGESGADAPSGGVREPEPSGNAKIVGNSNMTSAGNIAASGTDALRRSEAGGTPALPGDQTKDAGQPISTDGRREVKGDHDPAGESSCGSQTRAPGESDQIQPESENPPRRVREGPPDSRNFKLVRSRRVENNAPVDRTRDFRGEPLW
ncbi:MAG TPA: hypothetical protein VK742_08175 [Candidatus Sulfotelmatobacter sp.]|jgi:hypothetical protein|nr:hypothetical protein [Candidatus Sulfotelmatobacter sp.]